MKIVKMFVFAMLLSFISLNACHEEFKKFIQQNLDGYNLQDVPGDLEIPTVKLLFSNLLDGKDIEDKVNLGFELYQSMKDVEKDYVYSDLQIDMMKNVFNFFVPREQKGIQYMSFKIQEELLQKGLSLINNKDFTQYLTGFFEDHFENVNVKKILLTVLMNDQLQAPKKEESSVPPEDLISTGLNNLNLNNNQVNSKHDQSTLMDTIFISSSFETAIKQEDEIKKSESNINENIKKLQDEMINLSTMQNDLNVLMKKYEGQVPETMALALNHSNKEINDKFDGIDNSLKSLKVQLKELEDKKISAQNEKERFGVLLKEKIDQKNQGQQEAEAQLQKLKRALDEAKINYKIARNSNNSLQPVKQLLVKDNLEKGLSLGAFDPKNYE